MLTKYTGPEKRQKGNHGYPGFPVTAAAKSVLGYGPSSSLLPLDVGEQNSTGTETIKRGAYYGAGQCDSAKTHEQNRPANALNAEYNVASTPHAINYHQSSFPGRLSRGFSPAAEKPIRRISVNNERKA